MVFFELIFDFDVDVIDDIVKNICYVFFGGVFW